MTDLPGELPDTGVPAAEVPTVGALADLYLGNLLYSLELTALTLAEQGKEPDAAFYRGIARKLAEAHGSAAGQRGPRPGQR